MRVAVVHDWLVQNGGAEKVLREILEIFPDADIFTLVDFLTIEDRERILKGRYSKHLIFRDSHSQKITLEITPIISKSY